MDVKKRYFSYQVKQKRNRYTEQLIFRNQEDFENFLEAVEKDPHSKDILESYDKEFSVSDCSFRNRNLETFITFFRSEFSEMSRPVKIVDYDPQWPILFEKEKRLILDAISHIIVEIEHIGSTAVPNLGAKPTIDIMVAVNHLKDAEQCIEPLQRIGYEYQHEHEFSMPERRFFRKGDPPREQHYHLHMVELTSDFWKRHLLFRDYLRTHPEVSQGYYELKKRLANEYDSDREGYTNAKTSFIESVVAKANAETRARESMKPSN